MVPGSFRSSLFFVFAYAGGSIAEKLRTKTEGIIAKQRELEEVLARERRVRQDVETLSAIVQHDVYGPLAAVYSAITEASLALEDRQAPDASRLLNACRHRLKSIESAVESLGLFAGGESRDASHQSSRISEVLEGLVRDLRTEIRDKRVLITVEGIDGILRIDRQKCYHVTRNLLSNAIRCVPDGDGVIVVRVERSERRDSGINLSVSDNGPGLSPQLIDALTRSEQPLAERPLVNRGLGVGLYLTRSLAAGWGGTIEYSVSSFGGARLSVWIPAEPNTINLAVPPPPSDSDEVFG